MQKYKYTAVNLQKQKIKGTFMANDEQDLAAQLARQSLYLISAKPYSGDTPSAFFTLGFGKIPLRELTAFCRQFSIMQNTGVPILDCLDILRNQHFSGYFRSILQVVYEDVKSGFVLSAALDKHAKAFPHFFRSMVHIGEASGKLDLVFTSLADYYEKDAALRAKVKSAMAYPALLAAMTVAIVVLMLVWVVPTFRAAMATMNVQITGITKTVYDISDFILGYGDLVLAGVLLLGLLIYGISKTQQGAYAIDVLKLKLPVLRSVQRNIITARFCRAFGLLLSSGMDLNAAMASVEIILGNRYLKNHFHNAAESVRHGMSLTVAFETYRLFPKMMLQMVTIGEQTGALDEVLLRSCTFFDAQVESSLNALTAKIQPMMLMLLGLIVGILFIAVYSPMLSIMNNLGI